MPGMMDELTGKFPDAKLFFIVLVLFFLKSTQYIVSSTGKGELSFTNLDLYSILKS